MENIKFVKNSGYEELKEVLTGYICGSKAYNTVPQFSAYEFASIQQYWGYDTQNNTSVLQFVITVNEAVYGASSSDLNEIGIEMAGLFNNRFQTLFSSSGNQISIAVNPVSFVDGSVLVPDAAWQTDFHERVNRIIESYFVVRSML